MKKQQLYLLFILFSISCINKEQRDDRERSNRERSGIRTGKNFKTYCNPIDIDYTYMSHYRARTNVSYRSGADPAIVNFKGRYYLFVTRSHGYWTSKDMSNWEFIKPVSWYFNGSNAPAAAVYKDKIIMLGDPSGRGAVIETNNPDLGDWKTNYAVINLGNGIQDPCLFVDDDNRVYLYEEFIQ